jgi:hypothetical protein
MRDAAGVEFGGVRRAPGDFLTPAARLTGCPM